MTIPLVQTGPGGQYITSYLPHGRRIVAYTGLAGQLAAANNQPDGESAGGFTPGFTAQNHRHAHEQAADESSDCTRRTKPTLLARLLGIDRVELSRAAIRQLQGQNSRASCAAAASAHSHPQRHQQDQASPPPAVAASTLAGAASAWLSNQGVVLQQWRSAAEQLAAPLAAIASGQNARVALVADASCVPVVVVKDIDWRHSQRGCGLAHPSPSQPPSAEEDRHESHTQAAQDPSVDSRVTNRSGLFANHAGTRRRTRRQQGYGIRARRSADQERRAQARSQQGTLFVHL